MMRFRSTEMPIEFNAKLESSANRILIDKEIYQRPVGKWIYLSHTRLDISYVVSTVSLFMKAPYEDYIEAVNRILTYLKATSGKGLRFRKTDRRCIKIYTDSNWARSIIDRESTSEYCTFMWGNPVSWRSKKQGL